MLNPLKIYYTAIALLLAVVPVNVSGRTLGLVFVCVLILFLPLEGAKGQTTGFSATCMNVKGKGFYSRDKDWVDDGFSGVSFEIVYDGGETFRDLGALFQYEIISVDHKQILGVGTYRNSVYTMRLDFRSGQLLYTRQTAALDGTYVVSAYIGDCKVRQ